MPKFSPNPAVLNVVLEYRHRSINNKNLGL